MGRFFVIITMWATLMLPTELTGSAVKIARKQYEEKLPFQKEKSCGGVGSFERKLGCDLKRSDTAVPFLKGPHVELLIFVSFSMPKTSIECLAAQAQKIGGKLLIRGLKDNSFKKTAQEVKALNAVLQLDPENFEKFAIKSVPQFVMDYGDHYDTLSGNVSLEFAFEKFTQERPLGKASELLKMLRGEA